MEDQDSNNQLNQILPGVQTSKPFLCLYSGNEFLNTTIHSDELLLWTQGKKSKIAPLNDVAQSLSESPKEEDDCKTSSEDSSIFGDNLKTTQDIDAPPIERKHLSVDQKFALLQDNMIEIQKGNIQIQKGIIEIQKEMKDMKNFMKKSFDDLPNAIAKTLTDVIAKTLTDVLTDTFAKTLAKAIANEIKRELRPEKSGDCRNISESKVEQ